METQQSINEELKEITSNVINQLGFEAEISISQQDLRGEIMNIVSIYSPQELGILIGKNGQNIKAIEHIVRLLAYKTSPSFGSVVVDINDYRKSRASFVVGQARAVADRVQATKKAEALSPMSSYERRLVHVELASYASLITESIGEEPKRRVVVRPLL